MKKNCSDSVFAYVEICCRQKWGVITPAFLGTVIMTIVYFMFPSYYCYSTMVLDKVQKGPVRTLNLSGEGRDKGVI
jgi:hypothetical protein